MVPTNVNWLVVVMLLGSKPTYTAAATFKLGYLYPQLNRGWCIESYSQFRLAIQQVNSQQDLLTNHTLAMVPFDTGGDARRALNGSVMLFADRDVVGLCGTGYSSAMEAAAMHASNVKKPMVSPGSTSPGLVDKSSYPFMIRSVDSVFEHIIRLVDTIHYFGWKHVAAIGTSDSYGACGGTTVLRVMTCTLLYVPSPSTPCLDTRRLCHCAAAEHCYQLFQSQCQGKNISILTYNRYAPLRQQHSPHGLDTLYIHPRRPPSHLRQVC
jgi:hypothetical protein